MTSTLDELLLASPVIQNFDGETTPIAAKPGRGYEVTAHENRIWHSVPQFKRLSPTILTWIIGASDFFLVLVAAAGAFAAHYEIVEQAGPSRHLLTAFLAAMLFVCGFERIGGYRLKQLSRLEWQLTRILMTWGVLVSALLVVAFISKISESFSRGWVLAWVVAATGLQLTGRCLLQISTQRSPDGRYLARNVVIFGAGQEGEQVLAKLQQSQDKSVVIRGIFDDRKSRIPQIVNGVSVLGTSDDLLRLARQVRIDDVIIALPLIYSLQPTVPGEMRLANS